ncbi:hypothetical protein AGMMS49925_10920 [Deltaproteobacteria bacterium]|nr:hypothetical protein AGMMS49925_10920 [Deltaproteobacteria bacterium]
MVAFLDRNRGEKSPRKAGAASSKDDSLVDFRACRLWIGDERGKNSEFEIRIDPETKSGAERLFSSFGITVTDAVNIFLRQALMVGGLPFEMKQPRFNAETEAAIRETRDIATGRVGSKGYASARELFEALDAE